MKTKIVISAILLTVFTLASIETFGQTEQKTLKMKQTTKYSCPHHPEVVSEKPGKCPECGMDLVVMESKDKMSKSTHEKSEKKTDDPKTMQDDKMKNNSKKAEDKEMKTDTVKMEKGKM
jgi:predicted ATP-dependent serine protease